MGAGLAALTGVLLLAGGLHVLTSAPTVQAQSFDLPATAHPRSAPTQPSAPVAPSSAAHGRTGGTTAVGMPIPVSPVRVSFAGTSVVADVVPVATLASGALQLPDDPARVGWWVGGAAPGQPEGTMVLAGHIAGSGRTGAMSVLLHVEAGQTVTIDDRRGVVHEYRIVSRSTAPKENLDPTLFDTAGPPRLVLITCGGTFDEQTGHYTDNVVVIANPVAAQ